MGRTENTSTSLVFGCFRREVSVWIVTSSITMFWSPRPVANTLDMRNAVSFFVLNLQSVQNASRTRRCAPNPLVRNPLQRHKSPSLGRLWGAVGGGSVLAVVALGAAQAAGPAGAFLAADRFVDPGRFPVAAVAALAAGAEEAAEAAVAGGTARRASNGVANLRMAAAAAGATGATDDAGAAAAAALTAGGIARPVVTGRRRRVAALTAAAAGPATPALAAVAGFTARGVPSCSQGVTAVTAGAGRAGEAHPAAGRTSATFGVCVVKAFRVAAPAAGAAGTEDCGAAFRAGAAGGGLSVGHGTGLAAVTADAAGAIACGAADTASATRGVPIQRLGVPAVAAPAAIPAEEAGTAAGTADGAYDVIVSGRGSPVC